MALRAKLWALCTQLPPGREHLGAEALHEPGNFPSEGEAQPQNGALIGGNFQDHLQQYLCLFPLHASAGWPPFFLELDDAQTLPAARSKR